MSTDAFVTSCKQKKWYTDLTVQVLIAIVIGIVFGIAFPTKAVEGTCIIGATESGVCLPGLAEKMKPLADGFIRMIKMVIGPIVFLTLVSGIAHIGDVKKVGRVGGKALVYFEIVTTLALIIGMLAMNIFKPGAGADTSHINASEISKYTVAAKSENTVDFLLNIIPDSLVGAFVHGDMLQVLFVALFFGIAMALMGEKAQQIAELFERFASILFRIIGIIMRLAPIGTFGAMAYTVGKFGVSVLEQLGALLVVACGSMAVFIVVVLFPIGKYFGFSVFKLIRYIKDEILIVLGTGSSEPVLPRLMQKMERLGCSKPVVGLVLPTGYSFNLDGSTLYLAMCVLFVAQAYHIDLSIGQQISLLLIMLLTSKGAAGVVGSAFIALAATVQATGFLPVEGIALLLGIDRFMSSVRAITNIIGNTTATLVIAKSERELDMSKMEIELRNFDKS